MRPLRILPRPGSIPFLLAAVAATALWVSRAAAGEVIERILVHVNSRIVTQTQLTGRLEGMVRDAPALASTPRDELRRRALEELVNEALLEDRARELDLFATDAEVEEQIKRLKEQNQVTSDEDFKRALAGSGLTPERLRDQLKKSQTVQRIVGREVQSKVDLSDDAMRVVYEREKDTWKIPERLRLAEILVGFGDSRGAAEQKAAAASAELKAGKKWEDVVSRYSEGPTRARGGDLGTVARGELAAEIDGVAFSLAAGGISDPVATKNAWHILRVQEKIPVAYKPFSEVKAEILKREQETQFQKKLAEYLEKLKRDAVIRVSSEASAYYQAPAAPVVPTPSPEPRPPAKKKK